MSNKSVISLSH